MKTEIDLQAVEAAEEEPDRGGAYEAASKRAPRPVGAAGPTARRPGFAYNYGLQAIIDMYMARRMIAERGEQIVKLTYLPMIRIAADDPREVESAYIRVRAQRERIRPWDSPRERWRKTYGNFVRESEWALLELRKYFTQKQYEEIVVGTGASLARLDSQREIEFLNRGARKAKEKRESEPAEAAEPGALRQWLLKALDPGRFAGFLVGESEITEIDAEAGTAVMEVPSCAWHTCPAPASLPNPDALPEQGCLLICKGVFEAIFDGSDAIKMEFDPHLPETSCTIRISM